MAKANKMICCLRCQAYPDVLSQRDEARAEVRTLRAERDALAKAMTRVRAEIAGVSWSGARRITIEIDAALAALGKAGG